MNEKEKNGLDYCDRCGNHSDHGMQKIISCVVLGYGDYSICEDCQIEFERWWSKDGE